MAVGVNGSTYGVARRTHGPERIRGALEAFTALSLGTLTISAIAWGVISGLAIESSDYDPDIATASGFVVLVLSVVISMLLVMTDANLKAIEVAEGQQSVMQLPPTPTTPTTGPPSPDPSTSAPAQPTSRVPGGGHE